MRVDPNYVRNLAAAVNQSSSLENSLTAQLSSGLRVTSLEVDPLAASRSAALGSAIASDDSYVQIASGKQAVLQVTDSTLGEVVKQMTSAISLAVQGSNGTLNPANVASLSQQLTGIRDQVLSLANTSYLGVHLFGGSQGGVQPFSLDSTGSPAVAVYAGDSAVQFTTTPTGQKIQVSLPGSAIFGAAFAALNQLISDWGSGGGGTAAVTGDSAALTAALGQVSTQRSVLNSSLSRLNSASSYIQTHQSYLTAQQTALVSVDFTSMATQLKSAETQHQALLSVMASLGSSNLFNYMK